jgi:hypothetical protein
VFPVVCRRGGSGNGSNFEWDFAALQRDSPNIHLSDLQIERQPELIQVNALTRCLKHTTDRTSPLLNGG